MAKEIRTFSNNTELAYERRREIVNKAAKVFIRKGYDRTSLVDLTKALGMSKGGLYHYIGSKEDILYLITDFVAVRIDQLNSNNSDRFGNLSPTECLRRSIEANLKDVDKLRDFHIFVNHVFLNLPRDLRRSIFETGERNVAYYEELLQRGVEAGEFQIEDPYFVAFRIVTLAQDWATMGWSLRKRYSLEDYTRVLTESVLKEIKARG
jgi:AcrR family transcriptional regulator